LTYGGEFSAADTLLTCPALSAFPPSPQTGASNEEDHDSPQCPPRTRNDRVHHHRRADRDRGDRIITLFGDNIRRLFAMSADSLAGNDNVAQANSIGAVSKDNLNKKKMLNFGENNSY
jgi:hypothetical protein